MPFEIPCIQKTPQSHLISATHELIFADMQANESTACKNWEKDLAISLLKENWDQSFLNIHKGSTNVTTQENRYKIQSRWYHTPSLLHKFNPATPEICWRCHQQKGSLLHIWWSCTSLQTFWKEVCRITSQISSYALEFSPAQFLLHHSPIPHPSMGSAMILLPVQDLTPPPEDLI